MEDLSIQRYVLKPESNPEQEKNKDNHPADLRIHKIDLFHENVVWMLIDWRVKLPRPSL